MTKSIELTAAERNQKHDTLTAFSKGIDQGYAIIMALRLAGIEHVAEQGCNGVHGYSVRVSVLMEALHCGTTYLDQILCKQFEGGYLICRDGVLIPLT